MHWVLSLPEKECARIKKNILRRISIHIEFFCMLFSCVCDGDDEIPLFQALTLTSKIILREL